MLFRNINKGDILSNREICNEARCANMGGMRYSTTTRSLILSMKEDGIYKNKMGANGIWYYVGMGQKGDQYFDWRQNSRLRDFLMNKENTDVIEVHLFKKEKAGYIYLDEVVKDSSIKSPYFDYQIDVNGNRRRVCIFPIRTM